MQSLNKLKKVLDPEIRQKNIDALHLWLRGKSWDLFKPEAPDPVFVVGCSRSGTTVTFETLSNSNELLSLGYEIPQFWNSLWGPAQNSWASEAAFGEHAQPEHRNKAQRYYYQKLGLGRVLDKTCINVMRIPYLIELFPKAHFVFIYRDGRDNISSLIDGWRKDRHFGLRQFLGESPLPVSINKGEFDEWSFFLPPKWEKYNNSSLEEVCAYQWIVANEMALDAKDLVPEKQWTQLRYEDLFTRPVEMFEEVFNRIGVTFDDEMKQLCANLDKRPTSIVSGAPQLQKWKTRNPEMINNILEMISPTMARLGYSD